MGFRYGRRQGEEMRASRYLSAVAPVVCALISCSYREPLEFEDAGSVETDAGVLGQDAGVLDGGILDAGFPEESFPDAGFPDAGPECELESVEFPPFECESDVDFCDLQNDSNPTEGATELVAGWSFIDASTGEFVIQLRYKSMPFRGAYGWGTTQVVIEYADGSERNVGICRNSTLMGGSTDCLDALARMTVVARGQGHPTYPPVADRYPDEILSDPCRIAVGVHTPTVEMRFNAAAITGEGFAEPRYAIGVDRLSSPRGHDVSWVDDYPSYTTSRGGAMNDDHDLMSICDIGCPNH